MLSELSCDTMSPDQSTQGNTTSYSIKCFKHNC